MPDRKKDKHGHGDLARRVVRGIRRRARKAFLRVMPKKTIYRRVRTPEFYSRNYFDRRKDPSRESGYGEALAYREEFREVAAVAHEVFNPARVLDLGCAKGFQVQALRDRGIEAWGIDISDYAVSEASAEVEPFLKVEEYRNVHFPDEYFDLVIAMEVLEHIPPTEIRAVVEELRRLTSRWVWATIPCYGSNPFGPEGCLEGKIQPNQVNYYRKYVIDQAAFRHLVRDINGFPIHGHLIAASFDWWTALFTSRGFLRRGDLEKVVNRHLGPAAEGTWNCLIFEKVREREPGPITPFQLGEGDFRSSGDGFWRATIPSLAPGVHRLDVELRVQWMNWRKPDEHRFLAISCLSPQGEHIYGLRLVSYGEARKAKKGGMLTVDMTFAFSRETEALLELTMTDESRVKPLSSTISSAALSP